MPDIYISLGSNINPEKNLTSAIGEMQSRLDHCKTSLIYRSPAVGMQGADFYNAVIGGGTTESIKNVINWLQETEVAYGRVKTANKFTSRTLDLDLLLYGDTIANAPDRTDIRLPHPDIVDQAYVLQPLADIASELVHPQCNHTIAVLLSHLKTKCPEKFSSLVTITHSANKLVP